MSSAYSKLTPEQKAGRVAAMRRYRLRNPYSAKEREAKKDWLARNPGKNAEHCKNFRRKHPEKAAALVTAWKKAHPERARDIALRGVNRRRARKQAALCECCAPVSFRFIYLQARGLKMEVDHVQPLAKGGKHCLRNLQLLDLTENRRKGARWST